MASRIENKKSRSKLGSLGGLRTAIIGRIQEQPPRETRFGDKPAAAAKSRAEGEITKGDLGEKARRRRQLPF